MRLKLEDKRSKYFKTLINIFDLFIQGTIWSYCSEVNSEYLSFLYFRLLNESSLLSVICDCSRC